MLHKYVLLHHNIERNRFYLCIWVVVCIKIVTLINNKYTLLLVLFMVIMITYVGMWITTCFFRIPPWDNGCNGALNQKTLANKIQIKCLDNFEMWMASHVLAKNMPHVELGYVERRRRER